MLIEKFTPASKEITTSLKRRSLGKKETLVEKLAKYRVAAALPRYSSESLVGKKMIGQMLIEAGVITEGQLTEALSIQQSSNKRLGQVLVEMKLIPEEVVLDYLSDQISEIVEGCEKITQDFLTKEDKEREKPTPVHLGKRFFFLLPEEKAEIKKRISAGWKKLQSARRILDEHNYAEVINRIAHAIHHAHQATQFLPRDKVIPYRREVETKFIYTGHSGTGDVRKQQVLHAAPGVKAATITKEGAELLLNIAERYLNQIERSANQQMLEEER